MPDQIQHIDDHEPGRYEQHVGLAVLIVLVVGCFFVLAPFVSALLWSVILSYSIWPLYQKMIGWVKGRRSLAAFLIILIFAGALVIPLTAAVANLSDDAREIVKAGRHWVQSGLPPAPAWLEKTRLIGPRAARAWNGTSQELLAMSAQRQPTTNPTTAPTEEQSRMHETFRGIVASLRSMLVGFGVAIGSGMVQVILSLLLIFFLLRHGELLGQRVNGMCVRIGGSGGGQLLKVAADTVRGVIYGILGTALLQGLLAGVGFVMAGVPGAMLLGLVVFFVSVIPMGPAVVSIAAAIWLFHTGSTGWGIFTLIWGAGVSTIDNVVRPWLISRGSNMPFIVVFFGVLGGAMAFGLIGVFIGPTLLAVAFRLIDEWAKSGHIAAPQAAPEPSAEISAPVTAVLPAGTA
jgi:predicted PurR-regulated permease PerM